MKETKLNIKNLSVYYSTVCVLKDINLQIYKNEILSIIGPARSGKTTLLKILNRLSDLEQNIKISGDIILDDKSIYDMNIFQLRRKVGMVFDIPVVLPATIYENIIFGQKLKGNKNREKLNSLIEESLKSVYLFEEVKDRLHTSALNLSGGQQQRLCIARILALEPEVLLLDEPCAGLDPISTGKIEEALNILKEKLSVVLVTNNVKQAARASFRCAFLLSGELVEVNATNEIFTNPKDERTQMYISGRFG